MKQNDGVNDSMKGRTSGEDNGTITNPQLVYISSCESDAQKQFSSVPKTVKVLNKCKYNRCSLKIKRTYNFSFAHSQFFLTYFLSIKSVHPTHKLTFFFRGTFSMRRAMWLATAFLFGFRFKLSRRDQG